MSPTGSRWVPLVVAGRRVAKRPQPLKHTKNRLLSPLAKLLFLRALMPSVSCAAALVFGLAALLAAPVRAQQPPPEAVGEVQGNDVTVDGGTAAMLGTSTNAPKMFVSNGSVLTVHSGTAVMTLFAGGEVDICGPAKITILRSSGAITLALNFGRMRVQLPPKTSLRVFTPTVIGTPLDIGGGARDTTVGLNLDDSMCVLATSGAIQLANQFTDQTLIVPQSGEFFLSAGQLQPVAGKPGSCQCTAVKPQPPASPPAQIPEFAQTTPQPAIALGLAPQVPRQCCAAHGAASDGDGATIHADDTTNARAATCDRCAADGAARDRRSAARCRDAGDSAQSACAATHRIQRAGERERSASGGSAGPAGGG